MKKFSILITNKKVKELSCMLASRPSDLARIAHAAKVSDCKAPGHSNMKILTLKEMFQRLPIALVQVKVGNLKTYDMKSDKSYILCIKPNKFLKKYITTRWI